MRRLDSNVLTSWKAIAAYLGKGVRTAQRWEVELGLPVRRPYKGDRGTVVALCSELDAWFRTHSTQVTTVRNEVTPKDDGKRPHEKTLPLLRTAMERTLLGRKLLSELRSARLENGQLRRAVGLHLRDARKSVDAMRKRSNNSAAKPPIR